jgi:hypothetical protein
MNALPAIAESVSFQQWAMLIALAVLAVVVWWSWGGNRRGMGASPKQYRREIDSATAQGETVKRDMEQLLTELEDLSAKINTQVDGTYGKLQQLVAEADKRIQAMRILIAECKRLAAEPGAEIGASEKGPPKPAEAARTSADVPPAAEPTVTAPAAGAADRSMSSRHERIYTLADKGLTAVQIAQEAQMQPGEVELILGLRRVARS